MSLHSKVAIQFRHVLIYLGGYNNYCEICRTQLIAWKFVQTGQYCNLPYKSSHDLNWAVETRM